MSAVKKLFARNILNMLGVNFAIHELVFNIATSRAFVFDICYHGIFRVKREFSGEELKCEGGVKGALENFFYEVESCGLTVSSKSSTHRRTRNNEYLFSVFYETDLDISESEVYGAGSYAITGNYEFIDKINDYSVGFEEVFEDEANDLLKSSLNENLPSNCTLISNEIRYLDDSDEVFDIDEYLISS